MGQRRYKPFGSDRAVSGAADLTVDERFTAQRRLDAGGGNANRELYHYGARWYLPDVGVFTQPDIRVSHLEKPQNLNRYAYVVNNPLRYVDPTGQSDVDVDDTDAAGIVDWGAPEMDPDWVVEFTEAHAREGRTPTEQDWLDRQLSLEFAGSGPGGAWTDRDWQDYTAVRDLLGPEILGQIGQGLNAGSLIQSGAFTSNLMFNPFSPSVTGVRPGPDGTWIFEISSDYVFEPPLAFQTSIAATFGEIIVLGKKGRSELTEIHEYVHVLQYRREGVGFLPHYYSGDRALENQAEAVQKQYAETLGRNPYFPRPWSFPVVRQRR